ncbi:MAG: hypothetical protein IJ766_02455 [Clostridia bacterium]|nr:hypothetical protein [Clostridia bacterium]
MYYGQYDYIGVMINYLRKVLAVIAEFMGKLFDLTNKSDSDSEENADE